jgi:hypothetical protein
MRPTSAYSTATTVRTVSSVVSEPPPPFPSHYPADGVTRPPHAPPSKSTSVFKPEHTAPHPKSAAGAAAAAAVRARPASAVPSGGGGDRNAAGGVVRRLVSAREPRSLKDKPNPHRAPPGPLSSKPRECAFLSSARVRGGALYREGGGRRIESRRKVEFSLPKARKRAW